MALDNAQLATLRTALLADTDPAVAAAVAARNDTEVARLYNAEVDFWFWRNYRSADELRQDAMAGSNEIDNLEQGKRDSLLWMLSGSVRPSDPAVRAAFIDFTRNRTGSFVATALRTALSAGAKRRARKWEQLFADTANGDGSEGSPAVIDEDIEGKITINDVGRALNG